MKDSSTCPKCGSTDILRIEGYTGAYGSGNNIPSGFFSAAKVNRIFVAAVVSPRNGSIRRTSPL